MDQFDDRRPSEGSFVYFALTQHFGHKKNKHGSHLLSFPVDYEVGDSIQ
jgi:hypothetical protein